MTRGLIALLALSLACNDDRAPASRGSMPASSPPAGAYARPATTSAELSDATLWRCTAVALDEAAVGHPPPGATSSLYRRQFALSDCAALRGPSTAPPTKLTGFTLLAPPQRHDDATVPSLELDGQRLFDGPGAGSLLVWVGGPPLVAAMGFEGNTASVEIGGATLPARALALVGADAPLAEAWSLLAGWSTAAPTRDAHPLIALDALRIALVRGDAAARDRLIAQLDVEGQAAPVRAAARDAVAERPSR